MRRTSALAFGFLVLLVPSAVTRADRPQESREKATYIFTATVRSVYVRGTETEADCIVELVVEEVTKGDGLRKGRTFYAYCSKHTPKPGSFDAAGHNKVPEPGQRVKVYVNDAQGRNEGVYQDWFDVLPAAKKK